MSLLEGLSDLGGEALTKVLRRTVVSTLIVGALAVVVVALLGSLWGALGLIIGLGMAIAVFSLGAYGVMIVALFLLPETRGRSLASLELSAPG